MAADRSRYGPAAAAAGAAVLAASVFVPWYSASNSGRAAALGRNGAITLTAHEALKYVSVVLLVLAGMALLDSLVALARGAAAPADGAGAALAVLGATALALVLYRIVLPPAAAEGAPTLSPRGGAWLALGASAAIALAGLWRRVEEPGEHRAALEGRAERALTALSGWTQGTPRGGLERRARSAHLGPRRGPREP